MRAMVMLVAMLGSAPIAAAPKFEPPPEIAPHVPSDLRSYYIGFMISAPVPKNMTQDLFERHQAYLRNQLDKGVFHITGPLTDGNRIRGLVILSAGSLEEAKELVEADPAVQEKVLAVEVHPAVFPNLESLKVAYAPKK